jgi:hypothetical protein
LTWLSEPFSFMVIAMAFSLRICPSYSKIHLAEECVWRRASARW